MTITYPLTMPTSPSFTMINVFNRNVVSVSMSPFTGQQQVHKHQGQWWEFNMKLPPMKEVVAQEWITFLMKLNGRYGTFLLPAQDRKVALGFATGTPLVNGALQTGNTLITDGWTPSTTDILKAGDYFQLGADDSARLFRVLDDVDSDGSGNATITFWPNMRSSPANNAAITVIRPAGVFRLATNDVQWEKSALALYGLTLAATEVL